MPLSRREVKKMAEKPAMPPEKMKSPIGDAPAVIRRLLSYLSAYKLRLLLVMVCILISAAAGAVSSMFIQILIDSYITPMIQTKSTDFGPLLRLLLIMGGIFLTGALATLAYNRIMVTISQGVQKKIRDELFAHMQTLPIRYFDTHSHGDLMSRYTNDIDTLRQMMSISIPQMFSSIITIITVFAAMLYLNVYLTLFVLIFVALVLVITRKIAGGSAVNFIAQQKQLGEVNGYIEEMINGQKVIKVFCHEEQSRQTFDEKNEALCESATAANTYANILMPIMNNLGNLQYVLIAIVGGALSIFGISAITPGIIASFLQLSKNFTRPFSEISQQINAVVMALAGAERIFELMDEGSEEDHGYVTLVNACCDSDGNLTETEERTELWAWKHPHGDGTLTYTRLCGEIVMKEVDFGYTPDKTVLHNVSVYAKPGQKIALVGSTGAGKTTTISSTAFTISPTERSGMTASISTRSEKPTCAAHWAWCCRMFISSPERSWRTSATATRRPPTRNASPPPSWPMPTISSCGFRRAIRPSFPETAGGCLRGSASSSPSPGPPPPIPR